MIETFSGTSVLAAADAAAKSAKVKIFKIHVAMAAGGKGLLLMTGGVADVLPEGSGRGGAGCAAWVTHVAGCDSPSPAELFQEYL
ncbi:MAG: BMC domain-containing protein [Isosphaeraceae bacterium]